MDNKYRYLEAAAALCLHFQRSSGPYREAFRQVLQENLHEEDVRSFSDSLPKELQDEFPDEALLQEIVAQLRKYQASGIELVSYAEQAYPRLLREIYDPPLLLYFRGERPERLNETPSLAVVGSRKASDSSAAFACALAKDLARHGNCVISGLAYGIDSSAHRGALSAENALPTVAVLGHGLNHLYPAKNRPLAAKIISQGGLLVSHYEPHQKPFPSQFLDRNRIIAGLALGTLVVQAASRSGALATARFAMEEGRDVLASPGAAGDSSFAGSHRLIQQGAYLVTETSDIFEVLPTLAQREKIEDPGESSTLSHSQEKILRCLEEQKRIHYDALCALSEADGKVAMDVLALELAGRIRRTPGNYLTLQPL